MAFYLAFLYVNLSMRDCVIMHVLYNYTEDILLQFIDFYKYSDKAA